MPTLYAWLCSGRRWSRSTYQFLLSGFIAALRAGRCCYSCQRLRQSCIVWVQQRLDERERPPVMGCACGCRLAVTSCGLPSGAGCAGSPRMSGRHLLRWRRRALACRRGPALVAVDDVQWLAGAQPWAWLGRVGDGARPAISPVAP